MIYALLSHRAYTIVTLILFSTKPSCLHDLRYQRTYVSIKPLFSKFISPEFECYIYHVTHSAQVLYRFVQLVQTLSITLDVLLSFFFFFFFLISKRYKLEGTFTGQKKKKKNEKNDTRNENVINHRILRTYGKNGCSLLAGRVSFLPTRYLVDIALSVEMGTQQPTERILTLCVSSSVSLIARSRFATLCTRTIPIVPFVPSSGNYRRGEGGGGGCF